jgi:gliding motility-associated-like protein
LLNFLKSKKQVTFDFNTNEEDENFIVIGTMKCSKNDTLYLNLKKRPRANYTINSFEPYFCSGDSIKLNAINQSSTKALSFSWTDSLTGEILGNTETIQYFPKQSTTILLNISDNCSNPILLKSKIWVVPELNNTSLIGLKSGCEPFRTILNIPSSKSSTIVTPFLWELYINNSKQQTINTESGKTESPIPLTFDNEGVYPLLLQQKISEDKTCVVLSDTITVHPQAKADFQASSYDLIISNPIVSIDNKSIKANQYLWFISDTTNYQTTDIQHEFKRTGSFDVTLIAQNEHNCNDTISKIIKVHSPYSILIPNSFSPNKDGLNETWKPQIESLKEAELIIFNRWGEILVKYTGNQLEWDGTFKGEICQEGIYYYQIAVKSFEKKAYYYKGFIYLK